MLEKLFGVVALAETSTNANDIASTILKGINKIGPWIFGILAVFAIGLTLMKTVQFVLAKNQGNDQAAEPAKKGIIWGIIALAIFGLFAGLSGFIVDIANAFRDDNSKIVINSAISMLGNLKGLL